MGNLKRVSLELGGKSPNVIFPDAPMEQAVALSATGVFRNQGQVCCAATRMFVQERIYDEFAERIAAKADAITWEPRSIGQPQWVPWFRVNSTSGFWAISNSRATKALKRRRAANAGRKRKDISSSRRSITHVKNDMRIAREEIFGPVAVLIPFKDENDAVLQGNDTTYGLGAAYGRRTSAGRTRWRAHFAQVRYGLTVTA